MKYQSHTPPDVHFASMVLEIAPEFLKIEDEEVTFSTEDGIAALKKAGRSHAARWWQSWFNVDKHNREWLFFQPQECEIFETEER